MTWAALTVTGTCNSFCGAFYFTDFISHCLCVLFYRKAKPLGHQGVVCSRPQVWLHAGVWHLPGTCPGPDAAWVGASCYYEDGWQIFGKRASPVLWQLLLFSQAWARSEREGDLHVIYNPHESVWVAQGAECTVCQEKWGQVTSIFIRTAIWLLPSGRTSNQWLFCPRMLSQRWKKQKGRHQGARRWQYPNQFWHKTPAWGASTWLTSTTHTTLLDGHVYGGGNTFAGGCCSRPWSTLLSSGAKATSLLQPAGRGSPCGFSPWCAPSV